MMKRKTVLLGDNVEVLPALDKTESFSETQSKGVVIDMSNKANNIIVGVLIFLVCAIIGAEITVRQVSHESLIKNVLSHFKKHNSEDSIPIAMDQNLDKTNAAIALIQAQTGTKFQMPIAKKVWTKPELLQLAAKVSKQECDKTGVCFQPLILQAIMDRESKNYDPYSINIEETRIHSKVKDLPNEGALSKALSPFSFGVMQVNWGWHKQTCKDLLEQSGGDQDSLYNRLFDPETNIRCAYTVLVEKWIETKKAQGVDRLYQTVGCYNGRVGNVCNRSYAENVLNVRAPKLMFELVAFNKQFS